MVGAQHARYLDVWFETLDLPEVVLVGQDWGGALAMDWATRPGQGARCRADGDHPATHPVGGVLTAGLDTFRAFRSPAGDTMVLEDNMFTEAYLPGIIHRGLSDADRCGLPRALSRSPLAPTAADLGPRDPHRRPTRRRPRPGPCLRGLDEPDPARAQTPHDGRARRRDRVTGRSSPGRGTPSPTSTSRTSDQPGTSPPRTSLMPSVQRSRRGWSGLLHRTVTVG